MVEKQNLPKPIRAGFFTTEICDLRETSLSYFHEIFSLPLYDGTGLKVKFYPEENLYFCPVKKGSSRTWTRILFEMDKTLPEVGRVTFLCLL